MTPLTAPMAALLLTNGACAQAIEPQGLDAALGEVAWPDEDALTARIAAMSRQQVIDRYPPDRPPARRDVHAKAHGCVFAVFRVEHDLPEGLAQGLFIPGSSYNAWIRFSNGNGDPTRADVRGDVRGMAIKLTGVPGDKILPAERHATTQDFVLISNPTFFADDPARYATFIERSANGNPLVKLTAPFALGWKGLNIARRTVSKRIASPLETRYWSTVPSQLGAGTGRQAVKYSARPCVPGTSTIPANPGPDFLREAMVRALDAGEVCFDFLVQARAPGMSVEDSRTEWTEDAAPFVKVATILIPRQVFTTPAQEAFGESLSFTPWHSLPEHRPLGGVNRVRRVVYEAVSEVRHQMNGVARAEPLGDERF